MHNNRQTPEPQITQVGPRSPHIMSGILGGLKQTIAERDFVPTSELDVVKCPLIDVVKFGVPQGFILTLSPMEMPVDDNSAHFSLGTLLRQFTEVPLKIQPLSSEKLGDGKHKTVTYGIVIPTEDGARRFKEDMARAQAPEAGRGDRRK